MVAHAYITHLATYMPNDPVTNDRMEDLLGQVGSRPSRARKIILRSNGITQRHYALDRKTGEQTMTNAQMTAEAIRGFQSQGKDLSQIDCLVASTSTPDQLMPNHGVMVHGELGIQPIEVASTSGICLCGISALKYAWMAVLTGQSRNAVASGSDLSSSLTHARNFGADYERDAAKLNSEPELAFDQDFLRWMLSDGAGAAWLSATPNPGVLSLRIDWIEIVSFANEQSACMYCGAEKQDDGTLTGWTRYSRSERAQSQVMTLKQDVKQLNKHIVHYAVDQTLALIRERRALDPVDFDYFIPHYSSDYFRERVYQGLCRADLEIPYERWFTNLPTKGNTGAASIYIMLEELFHSGQLRAGQKLLCFIPESGRFSSSFMQLSVVA